MAARQHADWLSLTEVSGPFFSLPVLLRVFPDGLDADAFRARDLRPVYEEWTERRHDRATQREWVRWVLTDLIGYDADTLHEDVPAQYTATLPEQGETLRPDFVIGRLGRDEAARVLIAVVPPDQSLVKPLAGHRWKIGPDTRMQELLRRTGVALGVVTNGERWMLVSALQGQTTGFASWYAERWLDEPGSLRAFRALLGPHRLFGVAESDTPEAMLRESAANQQDVTDQLGAQVRLAIEVFVQTLDRLDRDNHHALLADVRPETLYEAAITMMMRVVFMLFAEENELLPAGSNDLYAEHYAVSTLGAQLRAEADRSGEDVLERRHDAWGRLLACWRAVYGGVQHGAMRLPAYGGKLFDPDRFPFLEGRSAGTSWRTHPAAPPAVDNRTVLHLLEALQVLRTEVYKGGPKVPQRLSFRALDIEQIGHVYEGLLDHTAKRATEPVLSLRAKSERGRATVVDVPLAALEAARERGDVALLEYLVEKTRLTESALRKALTHPLDLMARESLTRVLDNDAALVARVLPFWGLLRRDDFDRPVAVSANSVFVTAGLDRRSTGTHYTPKLLTEPIVQHTLDPLIYHGPAEGVPQGEWTLRSADDLLRLKVCDLAMGSGAFLVQACRYLAARVVEAWERDGTTPPEVGGTAGDDMRHAQRLVAARCLYGVDKNPLAVEMGKLSLWLITAQKDVPFSFLDHALRSGDSLLGIGSLDQLRRFSLTETATQSELWFTEAIRTALTKAIALRRQIAESPVREARDGDRKAAQLRGAEEAMTLVRLAADCLVAAQLHPLPSFREDTRVDFRNRLAVSLPAMAQVWGGKITDAGATEVTLALAELRDEADRLLGGHRPFHWALEFPEVFVEEAMTGGDLPGFAAVVGNPPFLGGKRITGVYGVPYRDFLVQVLANGKMGSADLCSYFFLRSAVLARQGGGGIGLLATSTIANGETREVGLEQIVYNEYTINRAVPSQPWPGEASLEVACVWLRRGSWEGPQYLDDQPVMGITAYLVEQGETQGSPFTLAANLGKSFIGSYANGDGFVLEPSEAISLIEGDARNRAVLAPFLNGEDLNYRPNQSASRWAINFFDRSMDEARLYSDCWSIIENRVRPDRQRRNVEGKYVLRNPLPQKYWQYADKRPALYKTISAMERVLVIALTSNTLAFAFMVPDIVFSHATVVVAYDDYAAFSILQSSIHMAWVRMYCAPMKTDARYTPSDGFETFPFPTPTVELRQIGEAYDKQRKNIMLARQEGLTKTYNRFHNPNDAADDIMHLRFLHKGMDEAVAAAYGWGDLDLAHDFYPTKQGVRYTVSDAARRVILDRLLAENHKRYAEEVKASLHAKGGKGAKGGAKKPAVPKTEQPTLAGMDG